MDQNQNQVKPVKKKSNYSAVRVSSGTQKQLTKILQKANKKAFGTKVKSDSLIALALTKIDDSDIKKLQENTISQRDRFEMYFQEISKKNGISREDFYKQILEEKLNNSEEKSSTFQSEKV